MHRTPFRLTFRITLSLHCNFYIEGIAGHLDVIVVSLLVVDGHHLLAGRSHFGVIRHTKQVLPLLVLLTLSRMVDGSAKSQV